jgi:hypothetical protein
VQKLFTKSIPSFANLSITGVGLTDLSQPLYAPIACGAWSSVKTNKILGLEGVLLHVECRRKSKLMIRTILFLFIIEAGLVIKKTKGTVLPNGASQDMHSYAPLKAGKINLDNTFFTFLLNNSNNLPKKRQFDVIHSTRADGPR